MKKPMCLIAAICIAFFSSCEKNENSPELSESLQGIWVDFNDETGNMITYTKSNIFNDGYCAIEFKPDGTFINKSNKVFITEPPLNDLNFEGKWKKIANNLYKIESISNEGSYQIKIVSVQENKLKIELILPLKLGVTTNSGCLQDLDIRNKCKCIPEEGFNYEFSENYIQITHSYLESHCEAELDFELVSNENNKIVLKEVDNANAVADCLCRFTISTKIENIKMGQTYIIEIWNEDMTVLLDNETVST